VSERRDLPPLGHVIGRTGFGDDELVIYDESEYGQADPDERAKTDRERRRRFAE
jgi:hypothetical protein